MGFKLGEALREKHWLRMFENRALRRIFGPETDEVTGVDKTVQGVTGGTDQTSGECSLC